MSDFAIGFEQQSGVSVASILSSSRIKRLEKDAKDEDMARLAAGGNEFATFDVYEAASTDMVESNAKLKESSKVVKILADQAALTAVECASAGQIPMRVALELNSSLVEYYDSDNGCLVIPDGSFGSKEWYGFGEYPNHLGEEK